jgi:RNA polymerase sigma-70 factor (ECF subfamily)
MEDAELVLAVRAGDGQAFGTLVARHGARVHALCFRVSGRAADAEQLAHDSFVEAFLKLDQLREPARFAAWVRQIALNVCRMWLRRRPREVELRDEHCAAPEPLDDTDELARVSLGLGRLSTPHRIVLALHYLEGLSYEEIATFLDAPLGTVMSRLHRARIALRAELNATAVDEQVPELTLEQMKLDIEREIAVLLAGFSGGKGPAQRLRVILRHSPDRFARLIGQVDRENLARLGRLLPRLGARSIDVTVALALGSDATAAVRARAVLGEMIAHAETRARAGCGGMASREAYWLVDKIWTRAGSEAEHTQLLLDLLARAPSGPVSSLLLQALLCQGAVALDALLQRYRTALEPAQLQAEPYVLYGLCRRARTFCKELLGELEHGPSERDRVAIAGVEALSACEKLPRREGDAGSEDVRSADHYAPLAQELAADDRARLVELTMLRCDDVRAEVQAAALRALANFGAREAAPRIRALLASRRLSTRVQALHALAELADVEAMPAILAQAEAGPAAQRCAALSALARMRASAPLPTVRRILQSDDANVRAACVALLGELGSPAADALLDELLRGSDAGLAKTAANVLFSRTPSTPAWTGSAAMRLRLRKLRGDATPFCRDSLGATIRFATRELRSYEEGELTRAIAQVCTDYSAARRHLIEQGLMTRREGVYEFTELGSAVWRVERELARHRP